MDDTRQGVATSVAITVGALGAIFVVGNVASLPQVSYSFGVLALLCGLFLVFLALWITNRSALPRADVVGSLCHVANGVLGICLAAWLWTAFSGPVIVTLSATLAVLSLASITTGAWLLGRA